MAAIADNLQLIKQRIGHARPVTLLAVSKSQSVEAIKEALAAGQKAFGENYVQEAAAKIDAISGAEWHLIGALQTNKTRLAAERFDWVQTIDRIKIAQRLSEQRPAHLPPLNVLIQVNVSGESTKSGVAVKEVTELAAAIAALPRLRLRGLMAIPAPGAVSDLCRMKSLYDELKPRLGFDTLSMGMTDDMDEAIAAGATMVRIGTAIFGPRIPEKNAA
jgi:PLP dependent protein